MSREQLDFKKGNPGAVQHGNFINYYQFHPPEERIKLLPNNILQIEPTDYTPKYVLDVGCNTGDLTFALYQHLQGNNKTNIEWNILGIDIDPVLIQRATEKYLEKNIRFEYVDIMNEKQWNTLHCTYFRKGQVGKYDILFCFSISMWIHLNNGDEGLRTFLKRISNVCNVLVIEPQPWKCYKNAVKRLKLANADILQYKELKIREEVEEEIKKYLISDCNMKLISESERTGWGRKLLVFSS